MYGSSPLEIMALNAMLNCNADGTPNPLIYCQAFTYTALFFGGTALGASTSASVPVPIAGDSDFIVQELNLTSWTAVDTPEVDPDYTIQMTIAGSGRQLMDRAMTVQNICGSYLINKAGPHALPFPYLVQANNSVTVELTNRSAVAANRVDVSMVGFKIYYLGQAGRKEIFHVL